METATLAKFSNFVNAADQTGEIYGVEDDHVLVRFFDTEMSEQEQSTTPITGDSKMKLFVTFKRYNSQDEECALENFPDDERRVALERQFKCEWTEADNEHSLGLLVHGFSHPSDGTMLVFATAEAVNLKSLVDDIQRVLYDEGGMTGYFQVSESGCPMPGL